jgi:hypothetical protein
MSTDLLVLSKEFVATNEQIGGVSFLVPCESHVLARSHVLDVVDASETRRCRLRKLEGGE